MTVELANPYWFYPRALVQRQTCRHAQPVPTQSAIFECARRPVGLLRADPRRPKPWKALRAVDGQRGSGHRPHGPGVRRPRLPPGELRPHPGPRRGLLPGPGQPVVYHEGQRRGLPIGVLNAPEDLFDDEHLRRPRVLPPGRRTRATGPVRMPGAPYRFSTLSTVAPQPAARARASTPPRCCARCRERARRERTAAGGCRRSSSRATARRARRLALSDVRHRHVSRHRLLPALRRRRRRAARACRPTGRSGRSPSSASRRRRRTRCRARSSSPTSSATSTSPARCSSNRGSSPTAGSLRIGQPVRARDARRSRRPDDVVTYAFTP